MPITDQEKRRAYMRAYYHRKLGGKGGTYMPREYLPRSDEELLEYCKQFIPIARECECGMVIQNRMESHLQGEYHTAGMKRKARLEKRKTRQEEEEAQAAASQN